MSLLYLSAVSKLDCPCLLLLFFGHRGYVVVGSPYPCPPSASGHWHHADLNSSVVRHSLLFSIPFIIRYPGQTKMATACCSVTEKSCHWTCFFGYRGWEYYCCILIIFVCSVLLTLSLLIIDERSLLLRIKQHNYRPPWSPASHSYFKTKTCHKNTRNFPRPECFPSVVFPFTVGVCLCVLEGVKEFQDSVCRLQIPPNYCMSNNTFP